MASAPKASFGGTERFEILAELGYGAMGVVYEALDHERNERVALKTLLTMHPEAVLAFKTEFRALQDLEHPNLVSLGEMFEDDGVWFFTMELLEGVPLLEHIRPDGVLDEAKLRHALGELARGVNALHTAGKVHRDIKPSNVLMTARGRGVLVDFGLVTDATTGQTGDGRIVGTVAYMAPEQGVGATVGPPADWYAVGVLLYEALTGRLPFTGTRFDVLSDKQSFDPAPPRAIAPATPPDLDALCVALLAHDPAARPTGRDVLRRLNIAHLAGHAGRATLTSSGSAPPFVGRVHELGILADAFDSAREGRAVTVVVRGPSGVGKTSLVRKFLAHVGDSPTPPVVLDGRCFERESLPYKAIDDVMDSLTRYLVSLPEDTAQALLGPGAAWIGRVFPVFRRIEGVARARTEDVVDPHEQRKRMFGAVREQLRRLAAHRPVIAVIDDFQWADSDSIALLADVLRDPDAPPMMLVATSRTTDPVDDLGSADVRDIELGNLPPDRARELASALLSVHGTDAGAVARQLAEEAAGHPLFIDELVRHRLTAGETAPGVHLDDALWARVARLEPSARLILEVLAIAGRPIAQRTAARVASLGASAFNRHVALLRVAQLVRTSGAHAEDAIETYHDRVREAVVANLPEEAHTRWHGRIAVALEASGESDAETLAHHLEAANEPARAAVATEQAADAAASAWAFDRAARLYERALALGDFTDAQRRSLLARFGDALANAGRGLEAGNALLAAAEGASDGEVLELRRRAAGQFLASGHVDRGLAALAEVLASVDMTLPATPAAALWPLIRGRIATRLRGLRFRERDASHVSARELTRVDVCWTAASLMGFVDSVRAGLFQTTHLRLAFRTGEPYRIARALSVEAPFAAAGGGNLRYALRASTLATQLADRAGNPHAVALARSTRGVVAFLRGEWKPAAEHIAVGERLFREQCTGVTWELQSALVFKVACMLFLGELRRMRAEVPAYIQDALARGDLWGATNLRSGHGNFVWLLAGEPATARRYADKAIGAWSHEGYHSQHFMDVFAQASIDLYEGQADRALARVQDAWPKATKAQLFRVVLFRMFGEDIRARAAIQSGDLATAKKAARKLSRESTAACRALGALHRAAIANDPAAFRAAAAILDHADMTLHATVARWHAGDQREARRWLVDQGVVDPDRLVATLCPVASDP